MKNFKWHGIPVSLPDTDKEWRLVKAVLLLDVVIIITLVGYLIF